MDHTIARKAVWAQRGAPKCESGGRLRGREGSLGAAGRIEMDSRVAGKATWAQRGAPRWTYR